MNTPKSIKRGERFKQRVKSQPKGGGTHQYALEIEDEEIETLIGRLAVKWTYLEDTFVYLMAALLDAKIDVAAEVFHALTSNAARVTVFRALLINTFANRDRPKSFDDVITEFNRLSLERNRFLHSYWYTDRQTNQTCISQSRRWAVMAVADGEPIEAKDLQVFMSDCEALRLKVHELTTTSAQPLSSP